LKNSTNISGGLQPFVPSGALDYICTLMANSPCHLTITQQRNSKLGDFRPGKGKIKHRISVNGDLNEFAFLITLLHEIAHLNTWITHEHRVKPHGAEWKTSFRNLLIPVFELNVFPQNIERALASYLKNPAASSCSDVNLQKALREYDAGEKQPIVDDLPDDSIFIYNGKRTFRKLHKVRKRIKCEELDTGRIYLFSPLAEVEVQ
jgi:SprT protein